MRYDDFRRSDNIEDRREDGPTMGGGGFPIGSGGGIGIGTLIIVGLVSWALGIDPRLIIGGLEMVQGPRTQQTQAPGPARQVGTPQDQQGQFVAAILGESEDRWTELFQEAGRQYRKPRLVMFARATQSACGFAQSAMGPFYCPNDQRVYLDTSFFDDLERRFRGCSGQACRFSQAYVITHEIGHHVQNLLGFSRACSKRNALWANARETPRKSASSCKRIVSPACGRAARRQNGNSWSRAIWRRRYKRLRPSATTVCKSARKASWCRTRLRTDHRPNACKRFRWG